MGWYSTFYDIIFRDNMLTQNKHFLCEFGQNKVSSSDARASKLFLVPIYEYVERKYTFGVAKYVQWFTRYRWIRIYRRFLKTNFFFLRYSKTDIFNENSKSIFYDTYFLHSIVNCMWESKKNLFSKIRTNSFDRYGK